MAGGYSEVQPATLKSKKSTMRISPWWPRLSCCSPLLPLVWGHCCDLVCDPVRQRLERVLLCGDFWNVVKPAVEACVGINLAIYIVIYFRSQVVAGTNYIAKIDIGGGQYIHVKVFQDLPHNNAQPQFVDCQTDKTSDDDIFPF